MANYWGQLWQRVSGREATSDGEIMRIAALQHAAALRRAEYAQAKDRAQSADASHADALSASRKRMEEAEAAHSAALQTWENKQSRQKSR